MSNIATPSVIECLYTEMTARQRKCADLMKPKKPWSAAIDSQIEAVSMLAEAAEDAIMKAPAEDPRDLAIKARLAVADYRNGERVGAHRDPFAWYLMEAQAFFEKVSGAARPA
jgi:hypothetical protein